MKRVWFAVIFILLCAGLCVFEQMYVKDCCENMISVLEEAQRYDEAKEKDLRDKKIDEVQKYWKRKNDFLFAFSEHAALDELAENVRSLKKAHNMKSALEETKNLVIIYYENEKITLANIF